MISSGSTILAADLNGAYTSFLSSAASDNATLPAVCWLNCQFNNVVTGTDPIWKTMDIVIPDDYILHEVAIASGEHNGTVVVSITNQAMIEDISITTTFGTGYSEASRYYSSKPKQLLLKGSILTVSFTTTCATATSTLQISVGLRSEWRRD